MTRIAAILLMSFATIMAVGADKHFVGGDISVLLKYEEQEASYYDQNGKAISDVLTFLKEQGWNTMRVRLFVDPSKDQDKAVCQDLEYVKNLPHGPYIVGIQKILSINTQKRVWKHSSQQVPHPTSFRLEMRSVSVCIGTI